MDLDLDQHLADASALIAEAADLDALGALDTELLGRKSVVTEARRGLGDLDPDRRREAGSRLNDARAALEGLLEGRRVPSDGQYLDTIRQTRLALLPD